jgi:hypothetical protein
MKAIYKQPGKSKLKVKGCVELCMMKMFLYVYTFHVVMYQVLKGLNFVEDFPLLFCLFKLHV